MLADLPSEIIYHIALYLPTANALTHLAQTCHRLHGIITAEDSRIFRAFVQSRFPAIQTPPFWKDAARALTSRSRALDRHSVIARFLLPPPDAIKIGAHQATRRDNPTLGYRPAIDSYEVWNGERWADRKEVVAWGAADELVVRVGKKWFVLNDLDHVSSWDDICGVHLLGPDSLDREHLIFARRRGDIVRSAISQADGAHEYQQTFLAYGREVDRTDVSDGILAAHCDNNALAFYHTTTGEEHVEPFAWLRLGSGHQARIQYSKLLSPSLAAMGSGEIDDSLCIATISADSVRPCREIKVRSMDLEGRLNPETVAHLSAISPLHTHASPGEVFLATWGDRAIRLHDLRSPHAYEATYRDNTDTNPIYSVQVFGHDRFLAGAGGDAVLKIFDLRMQSTYSYLDAQPPPSHRKVATNGVHARKAPRKDLSLFLSYQPPPPTTTLQHNHVRAHRRGPYRGPIYAMSSPSPSSHTVYTGVGDGVLRLDFASTDDLFGSSKEWYCHDIGLELDMDFSAVKGASQTAPGQVLNLSGYERPEPDDLTTTSKLRTQQTFRSIGPENVQNEMNTGWDRRWEPLAPNGAWRRRDGV
ncbi:hypothetical protein N7510_010792 [Penicillium lagena]|uniref:uncharacterized protein n=1 Tax=Penicillium lagena TaxID=94218 RepID=UPI0025424DD0|nr:uncharacterized protein N7510_010792 [Penicillium lagena]KAJ5601258.1 hypothetical protein N7510_010792 [Penicillium lagena]